MGGLPITTATMCIAGLRIPDLREGSFSPLGNATRPACPRDCSSQGLATQRLPRSGLSDTAPTPLPPCAGLSRRRSHDACRASPAVQRQPETKSGAANRDAVRLTQSLRCAYGRDECNFRPSPIERVGLRFGSCLHQGPSNSLIGVTLWIGGTIGHRYCIENSQCESPLPIAVTFYSNSLKQINHNKTGPAAHTPNAAIAAPPYLYCQLSSNLDLLFPVVCCTRGK